MNHLIELHAHTSESSACSHLTAEALVALHARAGYHTLVTTDHCCHGQWKRRLPLSARADAFLSGFRAARAAGEALGINVLLGMEARLMDGPEDYLLYGLSERDVPALIDGITEARSLKEFYALTKARGLLLIQAHPSRPGLRPSSAKSVDGYEVLNENPRQNNSNEKTRAYVETLGDQTLILTAGSDVHRAEDVGRTGILSDEKIRDEAALVAFLKENPQPCLVNS